MKTFDDVVLELDLPASELSEWIDRNWVLPDINNSTLFFSEEDVARARMLKELIHEIGANEPSVPVILRAMDQVYELRKMMNSLTDAIATLSLSSRQELEQAIREQQAERAREE